MARKSNLVSQAKNSRSCIWNDCKLQKVPASRSDVFKDQLLTPNEKQGLTNVLKSVVDEMEKRAVAMMQSNLVDSENTTQFSSSLESKDFRSWLESKRLSEKAIDVLCHAVAMQDTKDATSMEEGFQAMALYIQSAGRYKPDSGAFMIPQYGCGGVPQALCRTCAVNGGVYVLSCGVASILFNSSTNLCCGVQTSFGQNIKCDHLVLPAYLRVETDLGDNQDDDNDTRWLSEGVCIIDKSIHPECTGFLCVLPPGAANNETSCVRVLQFGQPCCPNGRFLVYLSMHSSGATARCDLWPTLELLMNPVKISNLPDCGKPNMEADIRPNVLWASFHNHRISPFHHPDVENVVHCGFPDGLVGYGDCIERAKSNFSKLFPDLTFMQDKAIQVMDLLESDDDAFDDLESELASLKLSGAA